MAEHTAAPARLAARPRRREPAHHAAAPRRLPVADQPALDARELRGRVEEVVPETDDAATARRSGPAGAGRFDHQRRAVRRHRRPDRGPVPLAVLLAELGPASATRAPSRSPSRRCPRASCPSTSSAASRRAPSCGWPRRQGDFVLPDPPPAKILFLVGGSGITPVMAMLRTLDRRDTMPDVVLVHSSPDRGPDDLPRRAARGCTRSTRPCGSHEQFTDTDGHARRSTELDDRLPGLARARDLGLRPGADARRRRGALGAGRARGAAAPRAVLPRARRRRRRGRHRHLRATPASRSRSTAPPRCSRPASRPASACPTAAGWASATPARHPRRAAASATCATATEHVEPNESVQTCVTPRAGDCHPRHLTTAQTTEETAAWPSPTSRSTPT